MGHLRLSKEALHTFTCLKDTIALDMQYMVKSAPEAGYVMRTRDTFMSSKGFLSCQNLKRCLCVPTDETLVVSLV